jgi:hypothetical protein
LAGGNFGRVSEDIVDGDEAGVWLTADAPRSAGSRWLVPGWGTVAGVGDLARQRLIVVDPVLPGVYAYQDRRASFGSRHLCRRRGVSEGLAVECSGYWVLSMGGAGVCIARGAGRAKSGLWAAFVGCDCDGWKLSVSGVQIWEPWDFPLLGNWSQCLGLAEKPLHQITRRQPTSFSSKSDGQRDPQMDHQ